MLIYCLSMISAQRLCVICVAAVLERYGNMAEVLHHLRSKGQRVCEGKVLLSVISEANRTKNLVLNGAEFKSEYTGSTAVT